MIDNKGARSKAFIGRIFRPVAAALLLLLSIGASAQLNSYAVDMSLIDGLELRPENIFNYRVDNRTGQSQQVEISGRVHYRRSALSFSYKYNIVLQPGTNSLNSNNVPNPNWTFSETGLRELFLNYKKLPQGSYEYCITVRPMQQGGEHPEDNEPSACVYQTVEDIFLINLITPENDAKIYEYNPMLAWVVTYPFASELSYKLRVAELKEGQNPQNAITRNNPVYHDDHVMSTGTVYPVTAKPLQKWQPYVWTVDAYYKGILLGGAEVWKFTIIDDSELKAVPKESYYVDIRQEINQTRYNAVGVVKIKYVLDERAEETLQLSLWSEKGKQIKMKDAELKAVLGDNRFELNFRENYNLAHMKQYELQIVNSKGEVFKLPLKYFNPELIN